MSKIILTLILLSNIAIGQTMSGSSIDEKDISDWNVASKLNYEGVYDFGFSEAESELIIIVEDEIVCAQYRSYEWRQTEDKKSIGWYPKYTNFTGVRIEGSNFYSDQSNGKFVQYGNKKCLKLLNPVLQMGKDGEFELGPKQEAELSNYYSGKYPQATYSIIEKAVLKQMTLKDLQIMRNEIFARYGYKFRSGGIMDTYFRKQDWYKGVNEDVTDNLTEIEKINVANILKIEKEKKTN